MPLWTNPCFRQKTRPMGRLQRTHPKAASWRAREQGRVTLIFNPAGGLGDTKPRPHGRTEQKQEQDTLDTENINTSVWLQSPFTSFSYQDPGSRANKRQICSRGPALATLSSEKTEVRIQSPIRWLLPQSVSGETEEPAAAVPTAHYTASQTPPWSIWAIFNQSSAPQGSLVQRINNFQAENQNLVNKIKPNLFFPFVLSPVSHAHRGPHVEVLSSVLQTRAARLEWLSPQLSSVAVSRSTSHARQFKMAAGARVQRGGSCAKRRLTAPQPARAVCKGCLPWHRPPEPCAAGIGWAKQLVPLSSACSIMVLVKMKNVSFIFT